MELPSSFYILLTLFLFIYILWLLSATFRFRVRVAGYLITFVIAASIGATLSLPFGRTTNNHFRMFHIFHVMTSWMQLKFELRDVENLVSEKPFIAIANHQSVYDVLGMSWVWPENCVVLLKKSLRFLPGFNLCAYLCHSIYINRFSKEKAHEAVENVAKAILEEKRKVWIYPEGTRNSKNELLPFKKGAFIIAKRANVPIVPIVFSSHRNFYDLVEKRFEYGGHVIVKVLPPVDSTKYADVDDLSNECRKQMQNTFDELNKELNIEVNNNRPK